MSTALFFFSQMGTITFESKPEPGQEGYGLKISDKKEDQIRGTLGLLAESYLNDTFTTAPVGFNKHVSLSDGEKQRSKRFSRIQPAFRQKRSRPTMRSRYKARPSRWKMEAT